VPGSPIDIVQLAALKCLVLSSSAAIPRALDRMNNGDWYRFDAHLKLLIESSSSQPPIYYGDVLFRTPRMISDDLDAKTAWGLHKKPQEHDHSSTAICLHASLRCLKSSQSDPLGLIYPYQR